MFKRFTDRARRVVVLANEEAWLLQHTYIGTEHLLLGLLAEGEGAAAKALQALGVTLDEARAEIEQIVGRGRVAPQGHIPFTPRAKKVLELSLREAMQLGHGHIDTEHLLLALIREGQGVAAQVLERRAGGLSPVHRKVFEAISEPERPWAPPATSQPVPSFEHRLADIELALQPLPDLLDRITRSLGAVVARVEALERRVAG